MKYVIILHFIEKEEKFSRLILPLAAYVYQNV